MAKRMRLNMMKPKPSELLKIAKQIPGDIDELGLNLDFTIEEVEVYQKENEKDQKKAWKGTLKMISDWFNKDESTREKFIEALRESGLKELADRFREGIVLQRNQETCGATGASTSHHHEQPVPADPPDPPQPAHSDNDGSVDDGTLKNIATRLFTNIDDFASALGVTHSERKRYKETDYRTDCVTADGTIQMLFEWREKVSPSEQRRKLGQALEKARLIRIKEEFNL